MFAFDRPSERLLNFFTKQASDSEEQYFDTW